MIVFWVGVWRDGGGGGGGGRGAKVFAPVQDESKSTS